VTSFKVTLRSTDTASVGQSGAERALARIVAALGDGRAWELGEASEHSEPAEAGVWEATATDGEWLCGISLSAEPAGQDKDFVIAVDAANLRGGRAPLILVVVAAIGLTAAASLALGRWTGSMLVVLVALLLGLFFVPALAVRSLERWQQEHPPAIEREVSRAIASLMSRESWITTRDR
jgi:hypothetical protein